MSDTLGPMPDPKVDADVERAPGGADATPLESDVGATVDQERPIVPDQPLAAQQDSDIVPEAIQESDEGKQEPDGNGRSVPDEDVADGSEPAD